MFNNVVVSVTGSAQCRKVASLALKVSKPGSTVHVVSVLDPAYTVEGDGDGEPVERDSAAMNEQLIANEVVADFCEWFKEQGFQATGKVLSGEVVDEVSSYAVEQGSEMLVMGHQHMTLLERWFGASVAKEMLEAAPCPVLIEVR